MHARIYTYKITFEETPHWYWGIHKEKKFGEVYLGSPITHKWMWEFYTPKIQILEFFNSWGEGKSVEDRLILPDLNNPLCLNEAAGFYMSLDSCSRGGLAAVEKAKIGGYGFYGKKTETQIKSSKKEGAKLSRYSVENGTKTGRENVELGRGIYSLSKDELKKNASKGGKIGGRNTGAQKWTDPDHPELGSKPACVLVQMQKRRGYPSGKENRIRTG
jgi:hypothetical protein